MLYDLVSTISCCQGLLYKYTQETLLGTLRNPMSMSFPNGSVTRGTSHSLDKMEREFRLGRWLLEELSVLWYTIHLFLHVKVVLLIIYIFFFTDLWMLIPLAALWDYIDSDTPYNGGREFRLVKMFPLWKYFQDYFPVTLVKTEDLDPRKNYIFCTHPHGYLSTSNSANFLVGYSKAGQLFPGLKFHTATLNINFHIPLIREYALALGAVSASSRSLRFLMSRRSGGQVVNLMVGGASESFYIQSGEYKIILNKRKGFIKVALTTGCCIVPVFCFGENDILQLFLLPKGSWMASLQMLFKRIVGAPLSVPIGRSWLFKCFPRRLPLTTVVGKPIEIPKVSKPTQEQIDHFHSIYIEELTRLFENHKHQYVSNPDKTNLVIVE